MKYDRIRFLSGLGLILFLLVGCTPLHPHRADINRQLDVFGLTLSSRPDLKTFKGINAEVEPCLHGFEYRYEALDLVVGTNHKGAIRRILTRNRENHLFGIRVGDAIPSAQARLLHAGFTPTANPYRFVQGWAQVTLLAEETGMVFGLAIEILD